MSNTETSSTRFITSHDINQAAELYRDTRRQQSEEQAKAEEQEKTEVEEKPEVSEAAPKEQEKEPQDEGEQPQDRLTKSWAAISKKEAYIRKALQEIRDTKSQLDASSKEIAELRRIKSTLQSDPVSILDEVAGKDWYQRATQRFLMDPAGKMTPEEKIQHLEKRLESDKDEREKWFRDRWDAEERKYKQQAEYQTRANQYVNELNALINSSDDYELVRTTEGGVEAVLEVVNGYLKENGKLLSPKDAAILVERELESEAEKLLKSQKLRNKLSLSSQPAKKTPGTSKSITNNMTTTAASPQPATRQQEIEEAANLFRRMKNNLSA